MFLLSCTTSHESLYSHPYVVVCVKKPQFCPSAVNFPVITLCKIYSKTSLQRGQMENCVGQSYGSKRLREKVKVWSPKQFPLCSKSAVTALPLKLSDQIVPCGYLGHSLGRMWAVAPVSNMFGPYYQFTVWHRANVWMYSQNDRQITLQVLSKWEGLISKTAGLIWILICV